MNQRVRRRSESRASGRHRIALGSHIPGAEAIPLIRHLWQSDIPECRLGLSLVLNVEVWSVHDHLPLVQAVDPRDHHP